MNLDSYIINQASCNSFFFIERELMDSRLKLAFILSVWQLMT
jgi:hypothetical protein